MGKGFDFGDIEWWQVIGGVVGGFVLAYLILGNNQGTSNVDYANIPLNHIQIFPVENVALSEFVDLRSICNQKMRTVAPLVGNYKCYAGSLYGVSISSQYATGGQVSINCECLY